MSEARRDSLDPLARKALERLLQLADKYEAGTSSRPPALTSAALSDYRALRSLQAKEAFEATMAYAQAEGAICNKRPSRDSQGLIERIELGDITKLASLLRKEPYSSRMRAAHRILLAHCAEFPILDEVLSSWRAQKKVRGTGPEAAPNWAMACEVVAYCRAQVVGGVTETPVRDASARMFKDSKRIEMLVPCLDVMLTGNIEALARAEAEVLQELGLYREPQPARMAGSILIRRERGVFPPDSPYSALPPSTVLGLGSLPSQLLTIENQTTFHVWARQAFDSDVLCLYTAGMPSPAWRAMYQRLLADLPASIPVMHWGDVDEGGFRIAAVLSRCAAEAGHGLLPWRMRPVDVPDGLRRPASARTVESMVKYAAQAGWNDIAQEVQQAKIVAEQEG